jgi:hypothetical protein
VLDEDIPQAHSLPPDRVRPLLEKLFRKASNGFTDDLQMMQRPDLQHLVVVK